MIGVQSSLIMFPINILIVSIFRHTQPRKPCCCKCKRETPDAPGRMCFSQADTQAANENVTLETVMKVGVHIQYTKIVFLLIFKGVIVNLRYFIRPSFFPQWWKWNWSDFYSQDISRIAHSLSKTVKSNIPCTEFGLEQQIDINAVLSVVEGFIKLGSNTKLQLPGEGPLWRVNPIIFGAVQSCYALGAIRPYFDRFAL